MDILVIGGTRFVGCQLVWRLLDGGPLRMPEGGPERLRHVYSGDVVEAIVGLTRPNAAAEGPPSL